MPQDNWNSVFENQVKLREELIERVKKEKSSLKFNRPYLIVSDIASQFYSEAQLELDYIFGKVKTKEQEEGIKLHERMTEDAVVVKFKELLETIPKAEELVVMESSFLMKFNEDIIVGKPDVIIFKKGIPIFLFEYKFSKYITTYPNQRVQAQIYCQILKELEYNTDLLCYGIIIAPRDLTKKSNKVKNIPREVLKRIDISSLIQKRELSMQIDQIRVFLYKFDSEKATQDLSWALKYWKGERKVKLPELLRECKRHKYKEKCSMTYSIVKDLLDKKIPDSLEYEVEYKNTKYKGSLYYLWNDVFTKKSFQDKLETMNYKITSYRKALAEGLNPHVAVLSKYLPAAESRYLVKASTFADRFWMLGSEYSFSDHDAEELARIWQVYLMKVAFDLH